MIRTFTKYTTTCPEDFAKGDVLDVWTGFFGDVVKIERHLSPEEREEAYKKDRIEYLREELTRLEDNK